MSSRPARGWSANRVGDRIGPPPQPRGGLRRLPTRVRSRETGTTRSRGRPIPLAPWVRGAASPRCPAPRPAAGAPAATPHVRGGVLFDNPVSAVSQGQATKQVSGSGQYSSPNAGRTRSHQIGDRRYLDAVVERRETRTAAGEIRAGACRGRGSRAFGRGVGGGVGSAWSSPQGHGGDA